MANFTIDPNTGINIPTPGVDPGPDYATNVSNGLSKLSSLTHTGPSNQDGLQIPSAGLNINSDLTFQNNNATNLRSTRLISQSLNISGPSDLNCLYDVSGNLWFNNGLGQQIQVTVGSSVVAPTSIFYNQQVISTNTTIASNSITQSFLINTGSPIIITLPTASAMPAGRFFIFYDQSGSANTNNVTIRTSSTDTINGSTSILLKTNYGSLMLMGDGIATWSYYKFDQTQYNNSETLTFNNGSTLTVNGNINLNSTVNVAGSIQFVSTVSFPIIGQAAPSTDLAPGNLFIQAANAYSSAVTNVNGGNLTITTGTKHGSGNAGQLLLGLGNSGTQSVLTATNSSTILNGNGSSITLTSTNSTFHNSINFDITTSAPGLSQTSTSSTGANMTLAAQGSSTGSGGNLILSSGLSSFAGSSNITLNANAVSAAVIGPTFTNMYPTGVNTGVMTIAPTAITMFPTTSTITPFQINSWQGSFNTQTGKNAQFGYVNNTAASGSNVLMNNASNGYTVLIPNLTAAIIEIQWIRRNTTGSGCLGNKAEMIVIANGSGVLTASALTAFVTPSGAFANPTDITIDVSTANQVKLYFTAVSSAADWQSIVSINLI